VAVSSSASPAGLADDETGDEAGSEAPFSP